MGFQQEIDGCLADAVGAGGLERERFGDWLDRTQTGLKNIRAAHDDGSLPLLRLTDRRDDIDALTSIAARFQTSFDDVIVLGTGGSSLGGQTLVALAPPAAGTLDTRPRLHFMDNVDADSFDRLFQAIDPARTGVIVISKSGGTAETLTQFFACREVIADAAGYLAITEPTDNVLRRLAANAGIETLEHDPGIGGRFSVLSLVGLLPAMIAGIDVAAVRKGAAAALAPVLSGAAPEEVPAAIGAAISIGLAEERGAGTTVLLPYVDRLAYFGLWYRQLWAESLGKHGKGTTPIRAMGTVDQHSQLQLYLGGPADKMYTVLTGPHAGTGPTVPSDLADPALAYLAGRTMGDLIDAEQRATGDTLIRNGRPTRWIRLDAIDAETLGELLMHFMLETMLAADLLGVDAFDQPAVEEGKVLAREYLSGGTS